MPSPSHLLKVLASEQVTPKNVESLVKRLLSKYFSVDRIDSDTEEWDEEDDNSSLSVSVVCSFKKPFKTHAFNDDISIDLNLELNFEFWKNNGEPTLEASIDVSHDTSDERVDAMIADAFDADQWAMPSNEGELEQMVSDLHEFVTDQWKQFSIRFHKRVEDEMKAILTEFTKIDTNIHNFHP